jgi:nucleoside-diphosphate-sugar epimerase
VSTVLVTGANGFIGLPLTIALATRGDDVHAISTQTAPPPLSNVRWHRLDLTAPGGELEALVRRLRPSRLVHLAWHSAPVRLWDAPENVLWVESSLRLARAFIDGGGRRMLIAGTCAEYDWSVADRPLAEGGSPLVPATLYGVAKDALRRVVAAYAAQAGVELVWARPFFLYGPREPQGRLVPSVVRSLLHGEPVATSGGEQLRDFMHVEDMAGALVALLDSAAVGNVNIGSGVGVAVGEMVDEIVRLIGRPELVRRGGLPMRPGEPPQLVADVRRLHDEVGYRPRVALADGLAATVAWWETQER